MKCPICGALLERNAGVCMATRDHHPSDPIVVAIARSDDFRRADLAVLKAARELNALVRGVEASDVLGGNTLISLGMRRLVRAVEAADGPSSLKTDLETFIRVGEEIAAELRTEQAADSPPNVRPS